MYSHIRVSDQGLIEGARKRKKRIAARTAANNDRHRRLVLNPGKLVSKKLSKHELNIANENTKALEKKKLRGTKTRIGLIKVN